MATDKVKKIIIWVVFAFIVYAVFTSPDHSADIVHSAWDIIRNGVTRFGDFFNSVLNH